MKTKLIKIDSLVTENLQTRVEMQEESIENYAQKYRDTPEKLPPVVVFYDVTLDKYYLADGFHRLAARKRNGSDTILANVKDGTFNDALKFALQANDENGVYRTNADKRLALEIAWANWRALLGDEKPQGQTNGKENGLPSARQLAKICRVSTNFANDFIEINRVSSDDTPLSEVPDATTVTREHLEERDSSVRAKLKDGKDRYGVDIPERLKGAFLSREPRALVRELNRTYAELERRRMEGDIVFAPFVGFAMTHLDNLINSIRHGMVHCVCRMCRGRGCGSCNNLGFQTKAQYDRNPSEFNREIA